MARLAKGPIRHWVFSLHFEDISDVCLSLTVHYLIERIGARYACFRSLFIIPGIKISVRLVSSSSSSSVSCALADGWMDGRLDLFDWLFRIVVTV